MNVVCVHNNNTKSIIIINSKLLLLFLVALLILLFELHRYIEPLPLGSPTKFEFENMIIGQAIPSNFIPAIEKGFREAANS